MRSRPSGREGLWWAPPSPCGECCGATHSTWVASIPLLRAVTEQRFVESMKLSHTRPWRRAGDLPHGVAGPPVRVGMVAVEDLRRGSELRGRHPRVDGGHP